MKIKKKNILLLICAMILFGSCKPDNLSGSGFAYYSIQDVYLSSEHVYTGTLLRFGETSKKLQFPDNTHEYDYISVKVKVIKKYKGSVEETTEIEDWIPAAYEQFLTEGNKYLFMTGMQKLKSITGNEVEYIPQFNLYDAVEIDSNNQLTVFNLAEAEKKCQSSVHYLPPPPHTLQDAEESFTNIDN